MKICTIVWTGRFFILQEYVVRVYRGPLKEHNWVVTKRYNDFVQLDANMKIARPSLELPPKKVFGNLEREFIAERQKGLQVITDTIKSTSN